jgi:hypothetical protein
MSAEAEETTAAGNQPTAMPVQSAPLNQPSDQLIASIALAGSAAIRRIIAERNELRRERERLTGANEELRRENEKTTAHRDHYRQIANELLVQLRQMHEAMQRASTRIQELSVESENREAALMARRFSPTGAKGK